MTEVSSYFAQAKRNISDLRRARTEDMFQPETAA